MEDLQRFHWAKNFGWGAPFLMSGSTNYSKLHNQRNVSAVLKKFEELAYNQAFKLENFIREMTGLAGYFWQMESVVHESRIFTL